MTGPPYAPPLPLSQALLRIHTIQASLAIERNSLSVEQVSAMQPSVPCAIR